jgi:citrate lyase beta subunit
VLLVVPVDGGDAARNAVTLIRRVPASSKIVLVRVGNARADDWRHDAHAISEAAGRDIDFLPTPLPHSPAIVEAHAVGGSVWALRRRGKTHAFLDGAEILASLVWSRVVPGRTMPPPPPSNAVPFIEGWDDEGDDGS